MKPSAARYRVGIDLGTTHTVVAYAPMPPRAPGARRGQADPPVELFEIEQLIAPGEVAARPLLPSVRYHPAQDELAAGATLLPWGPPPDGSVVGEAARRLGAAVPGRLVGSAKSWLSHAAVDRLAPILPWGAPEGVPKVSPMAASASYLAHLRAAWNQRFPQAPLERQEIVLTVPASFDDAARELTLQAARDAGLPPPRLLEEPQAALYDWLFRHRGRLVEALAGVKLVLVCDVGGGTTDLSLVKVEADDRGEPRLERVAVGQHLMLGGDNMDLALAHRVEGRLAGREEGAGGGRDGVAGGGRLGAALFGQLVERCRGAKERLFAADAPASTTVTLLAAGAKLIGGARSATIDRDEAERLLLDGFLPEVGADEGPRRARGGAGLVALGLPYAADPAITRHIGAFLQRHAGAGRPDALLLNGGVFRAAGMARRLHAVLAGWRGGAPLADLHNADPDTAVARGAVAYALARDGLAPRIGAGSARSYYLKLDAAQAVCVLPRGSEEGQEQALAGRSFALTVGQPVRFDLVAGTAGTPVAGEVVALDTLEATPLPPLATVVRPADTVDTVDRAADRTTPPAEADPGGPATAPAGRADRREIAVRLVARLNEVGTLDLACIAEHDPSQRWQLGFQLRAEAPLPERSLPPRWPEAVAAIGAVFGARDRGADPKAVRQLRGRLESLLGPRERWPLALARALADRLLPLAKARRRSVEHERQWLALAGWCLRPGFGDALDGWRLEQLWPLHAQGVQHGRDAQVRAAWWTLWRRVAGGLGEPEQAALLHDFAFNLRGDELGEEAAADRPPRLVAGGWDDMVRLGASLERIAAGHKAEIGDWLVGRLQDGAAPDVWTLWALGRLGARVPFHGSAHTVVPAATAALWLQALLALDWKRIDGAAAGASLLARVAGDRARDLPEALREQVAARLEAAQAAPSWILRVREHVALDEAGEAGLFGEALPPGLKLLEGAAGPG